MCAVFGIEKEYDAIIAARRNRAAELGIAIDPDDDAMFDGSDDVVGGVRTLLYADVSIFEK